MIQDLFRFVDATQLVSQLIPWDDRDKATKVGLEKCHQDTASKVAADKQARFGCKGNKKYGFGYKEQVSVDRAKGFNQQSGGERC